MAIGTEVASVVFGLASAASWGIGDFSGGLATRRAKAQLVVLFSQLAGLTAFIVIALLTREAFATPTDLLWGAIAGVLGQLGLLAFYQAMAIGQMGIAAPITALLSATMPVIFGTITQGLSNPLHLVGFVLALISVYIISRPEKAQGRPAGLGLAILGGLGFGSFLILIAQVHPSSVFWPLASARVTSLTILFIVTLSQRKFAALPVKMLPLVIFGGLMDAGGNAFYVLAEQAGRIDVAGVLSSLYPATTVILALIILKEKLNRVQGFGVLLALIAIPLIAWK